MDKMMFGARSSKWPGVRAEHLLANPTCAACGSKSNLEVHHVLPYHVFPELELDADNLVTLCEGPPVNCHFVFGHLRSWQSWNPEVLCDVDVWLDKMQQRPPCCGRHKPAPRGSKVAGAVMAASGLKWASPDITYSIVPDGTIISQGIVSNLLATFGDRVLEALPRALGAWGSVTPLAFKLVADFGVPLGTPGKSQGDPRFGDIRVAAFASPGGQFGSTMYPYSTTTRGGDIVLNSRMVKVDLFSLLLHETGHALGLAHSTDPTSVMWPYLGSFTGLTPGDVASIQQLYDHS